MTTARWRARRAALAIAVSVIGLPCGARGQAPASSPSPADWGVWTSLAVGHGSADGDGRFAANLAMWVTHGAVAASVRYAGTFAGLKTGDGSDGSLLLGVHPIHESNVNGVIAIGPGWSSGHDAAGSLPQRPVIALGGQLIFSVAIVGIGLDAFAGIGRARHYSGVGLAIAIGGFTGVAPGP